MQIGAHPAGSNRSSSCIRQILALMASRKLAAVLGAILHLSLCQNSPEVKPEFLAPLENHTVTQGRDVSFTCVVNHLQSYKVAWIKSDSRAILAIHTHMVAHNPRISVTHNGHNTWKLHVANVQKNDSGTYMCQVNTDPMRSQNGYMEVVIPPDIKDDASADGLVAKEGGNIRLRCQATGTPMPNVTWRREDGRNIILRHDNQKEALKYHDGEILELTGVLRQEMGSYLCIASNGVPPSVSKRYSIDVNFQPLIKVHTQLVAAPLQSDVLLQCSVEASPRAMNTWYKDTGEKLLPNEKYKMEEASVNDYSWQMNLTIRSLEQRDLGSYVCSAANALGNAEGVVRLQELNLPKTTPVSLTRNTDPRPRKKPPRTKKKNGKMYAGRAEGDDGFAGNDDDLATTQRMGGSGSTQDGHRTEEPLTVPSLSPPWVILNTASRKRFFGLQKATLLLFLFFVTAVYK
ncbi:lachesin-like isoform X2 [Neodiprion lecontei]|uniref:Lachesin-like isoform X2 n=1 Tax=Neodiprion lecontei TaxID=441921 RepID=A0ABM3GQP8_NEOLC|nr:lachesin-like isoform X2 [Neodiprion lecontei]